MEVWFKIPLAKMDEEFQGPKLCGRKKQQMTEKQN